MPYFDGVNGHLQVDVVSAASLPLPSGAATSEKQDDAKAVLDTINAVLDTIDTVLDTIEGRTPAKGQTTKAGSVPVVLASDQSNVPVTFAEGFGANTIGEYNITLTVADTEYSQALPAGCKAFEFYSRGGFETRFAFTPGKVATPTAPYFTLKANDAYSSPEGMNLSSKTIYFGTDQAGDVIELITWS